LKNLAIIPARSGSKGLKDKNIRDLNGKPLMAYTIEAARQSGLFEDVVVSTDCECYARVAVEHGARVPFLRPDELATDTASSWDVVRDVVTKYQKIGKRFDTVALLQPTSPLRTSNDIIAGYNKMMEENANLVVSVCEVDHSPLWSNVLPENLSLVNFLHPNLVNTPRQSLQTYYRINGALYIIKTTHLMFTDNLYDDRSYGVVMSKKHSVDIDDEIDFLVAEAIMKTLKS